MNVAGRVMITGIIPGDSTVTVTATNDHGSVALAFRVTVGGGAGEDQEATADAGEDQDATADDGEAVATEPEATVFTVSVGTLIRVDLSAYFSEGATAFGVDYDPLNSGGRVDIRVNGAEAEIRGVQTGEIEITLTATSDNQRVSRAATVTVDPV